MHLALAINALLFPPLTNFSGEMNNVAEVALVYWEAYKRKALLH